MFTCSFVLFSGGGLYVVDTIVDVSFWIDLVLNFFTTYEYKGHYVLSYRQIARNYLHGWFLIDFLATFPWEVTASSATTVALFKALKCFRLLRLNRLFKFLEKFHSLSHFLQMFRLFFFFFLISHWIACIWYLIGTADSTWGWIAFAGLSGTTGGTEDEFGNIVNATEIVTDTSTLYVTALYWSITTLLTVGYGDYSGHTDDERVFCMCTMVFGAMIYATIFGNVTILIETLGRSEAIYNEKMENINFYMQDLDLPHNMQEKVRQYYNLLWTRNRNFTNTNVLADLPASFQHEIAGYADHQTNVI